MTMNLFACNRLGALPRELTQRENIMENLCLMIVRLMLAGVCACGAPRAVSQTAASAVRKRVINGSVPHNRIFNERPRIVKGSPKNYDTLGLWRDRAFVTVWASVARRH
jgi:hypothetical protein